MNDPIRLTNTIPTIRTSIRRSPLRRGFALLTTLALTLGSFALSPQARAVCQQGCDIPNANTFLGDDALVSITTGFGNTASGAAALHSNTTGNDNTAIGYRALFFNTTGPLNTAIGNQALFNNTTGNDNTANGNQALFNNTTGHDNTANGS